MQLLKFSLDLGLFIHNDWDKKKDYVTICRVFGSIYLETNLLVEGKLTESTL